ncbi:MAG: hypothetical protein JXJ20_07460 [Anaerolineae bacterium]|nr:hypothetical protein [Anaerolineae bacterium]
MVTRWRVWGGFGLAAALIAVALGGVGLRVRAQDEPELARLNAQRWLLEELGKPNLIVVEYTYQGSSWPDAGLGCPVAGQVYAEGIVHGYRFNFLMDNMVRYEVHTNLDGTQVALCHSTSAAPDARLITYSGTAFSVLAPEAWLIFPNDGETEVLFAPAQQVTCDQPGMRVSVLGEVTADVTPDALLDDYISANGAAEDPAGRETVGAFGRTTLIQAACDDLTRQWRVTAFVKYGTAYRVEQWAPLDEYDRWAPLFPNMLSQFNPGGTTAAPVVENTPVGVPTVAPAEAAVSTPAPTAVAAAEGETLPTEGAPLPAQLGDLRLAHLFVGDVFMGMVNDIPGRSITTVPTQERRSLVFSPDGWYLAFIDVTAAQLRALNVIEDLSPRKLAEEVDGAFPLAWSPGSQQIAFTALTGQTSGDGVPLVDLRVVPVSGGEVQTLSTFAFDNTCEPEITDPADVPYYAETGANGYRYVLDWLPDGRFVISTRCDGGLGLLDPARGAITDLGGDLRGGVLAPDRARFLARTASGLAILDLSSGARSDLPVSLGARQVAWSVDGSAIYYSTETLADSLTLGNPADRARGEEIFGYWPVSIAIYDVTLRRVTLADNTEAVIWRGQGRGIGQIAPAPGGIGVIFSLVPSSILIAEVFQAGGDPLGVREAWPQPVLYWVPADNPVATLLAYSGQPEIAPVTVE